MRRISMLLALIALGFAPAGFAQQAKGNIYGKVVDQTGALLPGATVTLSGAFGTRTAQVGTDGEFRFLAVDHGTHTLTASLTGFQSVAREVRVSVGGNLTLDLALKLSSVTETVTVSAETPLVDGKRVGTATTISKDELAGIPTSREPWALMRTLPGVLVDRVNLAGSESGQQSQFFGKGSDAKDAVWSLDGIVITDQVSMSSPSYFNYDTFDEINFSTSGTEVTQSTGGIGVGLTTKRGTNSFRGNVGGFFTHDDLQSSNLPDELVGDPRLRGADNADHTDQITDYSFDLGGPIMKDRLWFYGSYGKNDIRIRNLVQTPDKTVLSNYTAKLNWQASSKDMVSAFWFNGVKTKIGRSSVAGGTTTETQSHSRDQGGASKGGPSGLSKLEWNRVFSPSFYSNVKLGYYNTGFTLTPQGGLDTREVVDLVASQSRGSSPDQTFLRPQYTGNADFNYFARGWGGSHEVKFGGGFRREESESIRTTAGPGKIQVRFETSGINRARFYRDGVTNARGDHLSFYVGDTFTRDRVTVNASLRFDRQTASTLPTEAGANPSIPNILPSLVYPGSDGNLVEWNDLNPRVGITYALDEARKTVVRASYARYAGLNAFAQDANWVNPVATGFLAFPWRDANGDRDVQLTEVDFSCRSSACGFNSSRVDLASPTTATSPNLIDPDYRSNRDNEVVAGIEHELRPNLAVSAAYTWRKSTRLTSTQLWSGTYWYNWVGSDGLPLTASDYVAQAPVTARGYTATSYLTTPAAEADATGGVLLTNRPDDSRTYNGVELSLVKRLSNRWMARAGFGYNNWVENIGPAAINNPTRHDYDPLDDGGQVVRRAAGSGKIFYVNAKWQFNANALVQLGKGFDFSFNVFGRQGYPNPVYLTLESGLDGSLRVLPDGVKIDAERFPSLWDVDARLAKTMNIAGTNLALSVEGFNLFNSNTELKRLNQANSSQFGRLDEILAPRIFRLGARLSF